ncbi:MAG: NAD(P)H-dependent amine dehydrogenase family protein [Candidatus Thorarchaeota archaeon]
MSKSFNVVQFGFGSLGKSIAKAIIERENLHLVGLIEIDPEYSGMTVEDALSLSDNMHTKIFPSLDSFFKEAKVDVDVSVIATSSSLESVEQTIIESMRSGMNVISICEELSFPFNRHPELSTKIDKEAKKLNKTVLGTGINPGYLMDLLPIVLSAPCQNVDSITVTRHMNSSHRRFSFQKKIGTGMTQSEFRKNIDEGHITGHVGLVESIRLIDSALNLGLDQIKELPPEAMIAESEVTNSFTTINKDDVLGLKSTGLGKRDGETIIKLDFLAYAEADPQYDEVLIQGVPKIHQRIEGGVQGDYSTIAMILNLIPMMQSIDSGLMTMKDIPVPRNTERMFRT